jgi:methylmalonyl-CoA/ethylmalonyl-CoA epimerase
MAKSKGYLRHVALSVEDPWETAAFYKEIAGLEEVAEIDGELAEGVFLTDGVCNLAILKFKTDEASQGTGKDFVGLHHIGFWVDDVIESGKMSRAAGGRWIMGDPNNPDGYEVKHLDLSGIIYDIAAHGWAGAQKRPGEAENEIHPNPHRRLAKFDDRREAARLKIAAKKAEMAVKGDPMAQAQAAE